MLDLLFLALSLTAQADAVPAVERLEPCPEGFMRWCPTLECVFVVHVPPPPQADQHAWLIDPDEFTNTARK